MKNTKKSFLLSTISLVLCFAMLLGTTYAWFTDEVSSGTNRIVAGNLDIDLLMEKNGQYVSVANGQGDIFKEATNANNSTATLWEPGKTQFAKLAIVNKGNLAVKYTAYIDVTDNGLAPALECAFIPLGKTAPASSLSYTNWAEVKTAVGENAIHPVASGRTVIDTGVLDEIANGTQNETEYILLAVHMNEEAGNEYQGKEALIDVTIVATQKDAEKDAFGPDYDAGVTGKVPALPMHMKASSDKIKFSGSGESSTVTIGSSTTASAGTESVEIKSGSTIEATATVSVDTAASVMNTLLSGKTINTEHDREMVLNLNVDTTETKQASVTYEIDVTADITYYESDSETPTIETGLEVNDLDDFLTATINIGIGKENVKVTHNSNPMENMDTAADTPENANGGYHYDKNTGILTIKSKTFSPFTVSFDLPNMPQFTVKGINTGLQDIYGVPLNNDGTLNTSGELISVGKAFVANGISFSTAGELPDGWNNATADFVISFDKNINSTSISYGGATGYVLPIVPVGKFASNADWFGLGGKWLPAPLSGIANDDGTITFAGQTLQTTGFTYKAGTKIKLLDDVLGKGVSCGELFDAIKEFSCGVVFLEDVGTVNVTVDLVLSPDGASYYTISSQTFTINSSTVSPLGIIMEE